MATSSKSARVAKRQKPKSHGPLQLSDLTASAATQNLVQLVVLPSIRHINRTLSSELALSIFVSSCTLPPDSSLVRRCTFDLLPSQSMTPT